MIQKQCEKVVCIVAPGTVATGATASASIDTLGFEYCTFDAILPAATATNSSAKWGVLQVLEADVTNFSSATSIAAMSGTTNSSSSTGFVIQPQNDTTNPQITRLFIDTKAHKRYLFVEYEAAASHSTSVVMAYLERGQTIPSVDSQRGLNVNSVITS
jgi:hypothetical protein